MGRLLAPLVELVKNNAWLSYQAFLITSQVIISFYTLLMNQSGFEQNVISLSFAGYYLLSFFVLLLAGEQIKSPSKSTYYISCLLVIASCIVALTEWVPEFVLMPLLLCMLMVMKDGQNIHSLSEISKISNATNFTKKELISSSMFLSMMLSVLLMPTLGKLFESNGQAQYLVVLVLVVIAMLMNRNAPSGNLEEASARDVSRLPLTLHKLCALSLLCNSVAFLTRFFVVPLIIFEVSDEYGYGEYAFSFLGVFLAFATLVSFALQKQQSDAKDARDMVVAYSIVVMACIGMAYSYDQILHGNSSIMIVIFALGMYLLGEFFGKLWSINFMASLYNAHESDSKGESCIKSYLHCFMLYKAIGGFVGFALCGLLTRWLSVFEMVFMAGFVSFCYGFKYLSKPSQAVTN